MFSFPSECPVCKNVKGEQDGPPLCHWSKGAPFAWISTSACQGRRQRKQPHYLICLCESIACGCRTGDHFLAAPSPFPECMESKCVPVSQGVVLGSRGVCPTGLGQNDPQKRVTPGAGGPRLQVALGPSVGHPPPGSHLPCQCLLLESTVGETGRGRGWAFCLCCAPLAR